MHLHCPLRTSPGYIPFQSKASSSKVAFTVLHGLGPSYCSDYIVYHFFTILYCWCQILSAPQGLSGLKLAKKKKKPSIGFPSFLSLFRFTVVCRCILTSPSMNIIHSICRCLILYMSSHIYNITYYNQFSVLYQIDCSHLHFPFVCCVLHMM